MKPEQIDGYISDLGKKYKLCLIIWIDSQGCSGRWVHYEPGDEADPFVCNTVGYVLKKGADCIHVTPCVARNNYSKDGSIQITGDMIIPKVSVLKIIELEPKRSKNASNNKES